MTKNIIILFFPLNVYCEKVCNDREERSEEKFEGDILRCHK